MAAEYTTILADVKDTIDITGDYHDKKLNNYIAEVKEYLAAAGVKNTVLNSAKAKGVIARGVEDLWNLGAGGGTLSSYFYQRVIQLVYDNGEADNGEV